MGEELYLYAQYPLLLCRLNLSKLSDTDLEVIHDFRNHRYPEGMGFMIVDSKPYLFGGEKIFPVSVGADEYEYQSTEEIFCFDTYLLDPTSREDPLVSVDSIPKLGGPKIRPIVVTIERKTYVLTGQPLLSSLYKLKGPHFEVFDHGKRTWERVNDPPVFDRESGKTIVTYFAWGHRLLLRTLGGLSIFDTRKLIWEDGWWFLDQLRKWPSAAPFPTGTAAEIEGGFYIALSIDNNELVAYEFDPDGVLKSYRVLDEISDVFSSEPELGLEYCTGFVTRIGGDGRMCLVLGGPTFGDSPGVRVAVFRVSAVTGGLSVDVECLKFFYLQDFDPIHYAIDSIMVIRYSQDSMSFVGSGYTENYDNSGEKTSLYPPIDDLISNVHISDNAGTVPASPPAPAANSVSSSPMNLHTQSAKYETEGNTYGNCKSSYSGKWDASHSGPMDSTSHLALSHSSSFIDSPHSQSLQVVPFSTSKGSLKVLLLHGNLDIWVYEAKNLPNMDMFHKTLGDMFSKLPGNMSSKIEGTMNHKITSDPYVSISVSSAVIGRTYVISNSEDPVWMQRFYVPVAHYAAEVHFLVKDSDVVGSQLMGVVAIPVEQIYSGAKVQGFYPILNSNGKPCKPGAVLSLSIQYTPIDNLSIYHHGVGAGPDYFGVPGTYFPLRKGGTVTLYQDAHVPDDFFPNLKLGNGRKYVQGKCWRDIFDAIRQARRLVYITGWSVWHQVRLVRDADNASVYTLGDLLKSKSQEGVRVLLLVWDDPTSRSILGYKTDGVMQTHDEETRRFFKHSSVQVLLCPRTAGKKHSWVKQREVGTIYTHHQKTVIVDADAGDNRRKIVAFLGGLDLCDGRYDTPQHPIFRTLRTVHSDDYHNPTFTGHLAGCPREPWHDLHCKIDGPAAYDVLTNFEERWLKASKPHGIKKLKMSYDDSLLRIDRMPEIAGLMDTPCVSEYDPEGWHVQIFRSIDSNSVRKFPNDPKEAISKNLMCGKNVLIDMSIHTAYVKAIRAAQHYIYIENQYFIGSSYNWSAYRDLGANNLIPMEIALKIADKIRAHERFSAYVVIPMWPEGNPTGAATQRILFWQHKTMQMMYETIYKALVEVGLEDSFTPQDYLNFYCLGNREVVGNDISPPSTESPAPANSPQALSRKNRRFMIYVHSKGMIVDDEFVILGSANINQRSMEGTRDTEIAMGAYQPHHTWARKSSNPQGQIYGYRMSLWAEHLGTIEDCFSRPESVDCVRKVRSMGEANWKQFASDEVTEMKGHLMKYPVEVDRKGKVRSLPGCESFPDVGGQIVGSFLAIQENLTI